MKINILFVILCFISFKNSFSQNPYIFKDSLIKDNSYPSYYLLPHIGKYLESQTLYDIENNNQDYLSFLKDSKTDTSIISKDYSVKEAYQIIIDSIEVNKIVIFNESHNCASCRAVTAHCLEKLKQNNHIYFSSEAYFKEYIDSVKTYKFPFIVGTSYNHYLNEPTYAELTRVALRKKLNLFWYDSGDLNSYTFTYKNGIYTINNIVDSNWKSILIDSSIIDCFNDPNRKREVIQAANIYQIILKDSLAKIILHVGEGHGYEWDCMMGYVLKKISKINPFTIDQNLMKPNSSPKFNHIVYNALNPKSEVILQNKINKKLLNANDIINSPPFIDHAESRNDILLFQRNFATENNRPSWKNLLFNCTFSARKNPFFKGHKLIYIAYYTSEFILKKQNAIPVDIIYADNPILNITFYLRPNHDYHILIKNFKEEIIYQYGIHRDYWKR